jgi:hypothetical protein
MDFVTKCRHVAGNWSLFLLKIYVSLCQVLYFKGPTEDNVAFWQELSSKLEPTDLDYFGFWFKITNISLS